jgi:hypothetical protein
LEIAKRRYIKMINSRGLLWSEILMIG